MSRHALRLHEDRLAPGSRAAPLPARNRIIYVVDGSLTVTEGGAPRTLAADTAWFGAGAAVLDTADTAARLWRWELTGSDPPDDGLLRGEGAVSALKLAQEIVLDPAVPYLMRCDRVDFPPGGIAYTHIHWGPGTRCLLRGELSVRTEGVERTLRPGDPWFERGPSPVYAVASDAEPTSFVRAMVIPAAIRGQTSIRYVLDEDQDKPKPQQYTRYLDEPIDL